MKFKMNSRISADSRGISAAVLLALALSGGCREEVVSHATVPKEAPSARMPGMGPMGGGPMGGGPMGGGAGMGVAPPPRPEGAAAMHWTLPTGWTEEPGSGMRYATIKSPTEGKLDISVVMLPGAAGGELANANRWRGQLGLPPVDDAGLASQRTVVASKAGQVVLFDFVSDGDQKSRMLAGLLTAADGSTWFIKMIGDGSVVAANQADFTAMLGTLHFD